MRVGVFFALPLINTIVLVSINGRRLSIPRELPDPKSSPQSFSCMSHRLRAIISPTQFLSRLNDSGTLRPSLRSTSHNCRVSGAHPGSVLVEQRDSTLECFAPSVRLDLHLTLKSWNFVAGHRFSSQVATKQPHLVFILWVGIPPFLEEHMSPSKWTQFPPSPLVAGHTREMDRANISIL